MGRENKDKNVTLEEEPKSENKTMTTENSGDLVGNRTPPPVSAQAQQAVEIEESSDDSVLIVVHEAIEPAPRVGDFDCAREVAPAFKPKEGPYRVPRHVALVIVDAGKGNIVSK